MHLSRAKPGNPTSIIYRRSRDVFVPTSVPSFLHSRFSSLWPAFTLTVHINALYNESVHGREEYAT